jgi:isoaspartyl peptidase/L-asparaginase-like protein (Ntn-hydrolase superfamily)
MKKKRENGMHFAVFLVGKGKSRFLYRNQMPIHCPSLSKKEKKEKEKEKEKEKDFFASSVLASVAF